MGGERADATLTPCDTPQQKNKINKQEYTGIHERSFTSFVSRHFDWPWPEADKQKLLQIIDAQF